MLLRVFIPALHHSLGLVSLHVFGPAHVCLGLARIPLRLARLRLSLASFRLRPLGLGPAKLRHRLGLVRIRLHRFSFGLISFCLELASLYIFLSCF